MSYITSFMDGEKYGADDINKIVSHFIHSGVEEAFVDGEPYNVRRLNDLSKPITTRGVIGSESSALLVGKSGDSYYISPGTAFFGNGSTLEVIENEVITLADSTLTNYVYLVSSEEKNRNYIEVSTTEPDVANENFVLLAEISPDGTITDRRCYATGKLRGMYQDNEYVLKKMFIQDSVVFPGGKGGDSDVYITHDLGCSSITMLVLVAWLEIDENGRLKYEGTVDSNTGNVVTLWLPKQNLKYGVYSSSVNYEKGTGIAGETASSGDDFLNEFILSYRSENALYDVNELRLDISYLNNNNWQFHYCRTMNDRYNSQIVRYKLFYI